jgi:hypothetical protein
MFLEMSSRSCAALCREQNGLTNEWSFLSVGWCTTSELLDGNLASFPKVPLFSCTCRSHNVLESLGWWPVWWQLLILNTQMSTKLAMPSLSCFEWTNDSISLDHRGSAHSSTCFQIFVCCQQANMYLSMSWEGHTSELTLLNQWVLCP